MQAKIQTRLDTKRVELGEIAPLNTPYVVMIDPSSLCNHKCRFCPTGDLALIKQTKRYRGNLDFNIYKKAIDDMSNFQNPIKVLRFYKVGEPLINPHFANMIAYARSKNYIQKIETTTNGLLLGSNLNEKIISAGISQINISVNGVSDEQIYYYTKTKVDFKKYVQNIKNLYNQRQNCIIYIKAIKQNLNANEQKKFYDIFGEISDRIFLENISPAWPEYEFDGIEMSFNEGHYGQKAYEKKVCPYLFYVMVINSDGGVSTCTQDWKQNMIVGNVSTENVRDIWLGKHLNEYRLNHLNDKKNIYQTCKNCNVISFGVLDDIDSFRNSIKKRLEKGILK